MDGLGMALRAAELAVQALRTGGNDGRAVRRQAARDVTIEADVLADRAIRESLRSASPFPILSEESRTEGPAAGEPGYHWIVDPVDGSLNFLRGIPLSCVSIALWRGMEPLVGVIRDLGRDETFSGVVGRGAWLNGAPARVSAAIERSRAVLCTGFPVRSDFSSGALVAFVEHAQAYQKVRVLGSAALSLAYVACGRADAYEERGIALWDVAAGIALVRAAGGEARYRAAGAEYLLDVTAGTPRLMSDSA